MTDLKIAKKVTLKPITEIAEKLGINPNDIEMYGKYKAKIPIDKIKRNEVKKSHLVLVSAISPTPAGEGKTTISIRLSKALNQLKKIYLGLETDFFSTLTRIRLHPQTSRSYQGHSHRNNIRYQLFISIFYESLHLNSLRSFLLLFKY